MPPNPKSRTHPIKMDSYREAQLNSYATRGFRATADRDYIHARLAFQAGLSPQFRWSSLHCLEKYGKCILLLNKIDSRKIRHEVQESIVRLNKSGPFQIILSKTTTSFIRRLEHNAHHRYLETSWDVQSYDLSSLDRAVNELRRYCQVLDFEIQTSNGIKNLLPLELERIKFIESAPLEHVSLGGWLEKVIKETNHPAHLPLMWNNAVFGNQDDSSFFFQSERSPCELHPDMVDDLSKLVFIPREVLKSYSKNP